MNDEMRKALTEYLDECWHEFKELNYLPILGANTHDHKCTKCVFIFSYNFVFNKGRGHRTFTTWEDLGALKNKLVEKGDWRDFFGFARNSWDEANVNNWLMVPARFCELCSQFLEERGKNGKA